MTKNYSHVCTSCSSPTLLTKETISGGFLENIMIYGACILPIFVLLSWGLFFWGIVWGVLWSIAVYFYNNHKKKICPTCKMKSLIPITTPLGMELMKHNGWI